MPCETLKRDTSGSGSEVSSRVKVALSHAT